MIIDGHCHIGNGIYKRQSLEQLIENMDTYGVDISVIVPTEESIAVYNEEGNRQTLEAINRYPERLTGLAVANPWFGQRAKELLDAALGAGLKGVKFHSVVQGFHINDPIVYPLLEVAGKWNVPVYFHTGTPVMAIPFQVADLAEKFPEISFVVGHSGYSDFWNDVPYIAAKYENVYFDTSLSLTSRNEDIVRAGASQRLLFGSDTPHSSLGYELKKVKMMDVDEQVQKDILGLNAARLLKIGGEET